MSDAAREVSERADGVLYSRAAVDPSTVSEEDRTVEVIASTEAVDGHETILRQNWDLSRFLANPVVLYSHQSRELPIGTASDVRVTDGQLRAKLTFSTEDLNPLAERVWKNVKAKVVRGISVGFMPHSYKWEKQNDVEVLVLDDNELLEISVTPVPSNPETLALMKSRALGAQREKQEIPAQPSPQPAQEPEVIAMSEPIKNTNDSATPSVARALGLAPGSSEQDMLAAATRTRELELQVIAITGAPSSAEALGAVRALKAKADGYDKLSDEVNQLRAERDKQNFETQVVRGRSEGKLSVAEEKFEREKFDRKVAEGRGAEAVAELKGFLDVAATRVVARVTQPAPDAAGSSVPLTYNGKSYRNMTGTERARLSRENNELYKAMRGEWIAAGQPQPENSAA